MPISQIQAQTNSLNSIVKIHFQIWEMPVETHDLTKKPTDTDRDMLPSCCLHFRDFTVQEQNQAICSL